MNHRHAVRIVCILLWGVLPAGLRAQPKNYQWIDLLPYRHTHGVRLSREVVYGFGRSTITTFNVQDGTRGRISKLNHLHHSGIVDLYASPRGDTLIVAYEDGSLDLVVEGQATQTNGDLRLRQQSGELAPITRIVRTENFLWGMARDRLYTIKANPLQLEDAYPLWVPSQPGVALELHDLINWNGATILATSGGLFMPSHDIRQSRRFEQLPAVEGNYTALACKRDSKTLFALSVTPSQSTIHQLEGPTWLAIHSEGEPILELCSADKFVLYRTQSAIYRISETGIPELVLRLGPDMETGQVRGMAMLRDVLYLATTKLGLVVLRNGTLESLSPESPHFYGNHATTSTPAGPVMSQGGLDADGNPQGNPFNLFHLSKASGPTSITQPDLQDATEVVAIPGTMDEFIVGTASGMILHYAGNRLKARYDENNSPLENLSRTVRITGLTVDWDGGWWIFADGNSKPLVHRRRSGEWFAFRPNARIGDASSFLPNHQRVFMTPSPSGSLWLTSPGDNILYGIQIQRFVSSDGEEGSVAKFIYNWDDRRIVPGGRTLVAKNKSLWLPTERTIIWCSDPDVLFQGGTVRFNFVQGWHKDPLLDGFTLMREADMTDMLFDSGENLWVATYAGGVFHIDPSVPTLMHHFTRENSPLPSNHVTSLAYEPKTGILYLSTPEGSLGLISDSRTESQDLDHIRPYPNPVRPGYTGEVTIDNLMAGVVLKITTTSGELVRELTSNGGRARWDLRNGRGQRVATGIYLLFASDSTGKITGTAKLAVVR